MSPSLGNFNNHPSVRRRPSSDVRIIYPIRDDPCCCLESQATTAVACASTWATPTELPGVTSHFLVVNSLYLRKNPVFWGAHRLRRLWCDESRGEIRRLRKIHHNADDANREASGNLDNDVLEHEAQLIAMQDVFTTLTQLDCCVSEDETVGGLLAASKPLTEFLCRASMLRRLHLAFGEFPNGVPKEMHLLGDYDGHGCALLGSLADRRPWLCLERLNLGIATGVPSLLRFLESISASLRCLELNHVILVPETVEEPQTHNDNASGVQKATWEYALPKIAQCLPILQSLDISSLCFYLGRSPLVEILLDPQELDPENTCGCLDSHKRAVIDELLRDKEVRQSLDPVDYIRMHCDHGDQESADSARSSSLDDLYDESEEGTDLSGKDL